MRVGLALVTVVFVSGLAFVGGVSGAAMAAAACREERNDADTLVDQCEQVSPATHPPCNVSNPCAMIVSEIRRGCGLLDAPDRPKFCNAY